MTPINILTNDKHLWLLKGFSYCFNQHWPGQKVNIYGFANPDFILPQNFNFISLAENNYPAQRWSTALIEMCQLIEEDYFILMLEDYWLTSKVDITGIKLMSRYIRSTTNVLRMDLSGNRAAYTQSQYYDKIKGYEIVESPVHTPYQMSFQAAIWNKQLLLSILKRRETPWEAEINGCARLRHREDIRVLGAKDTLLNYKPVHKMNLRKTNGYEMRLNHMPQKQLKELKERGCLQ